MSLHRLSFDDPEPPKDIMKSFPSQDDGDVLVTLTPFKEFQLHSNVLRRLSSTFADLLNEGIAAKLTAKAITAGVVIRYGLQLSRDGTFKRMVRIQVDLSNLANFRCRMSTKTV